MLPEAPALRSPELRPKASDLHRDLDLNFSVDTADQQISITTYDHHPLTKWKAFFSPIAHVRVDDFITDLKL